jgi:hypothetical protein
MERAGMFTSTENRTPEEAPSWARPTLRIVAALIGLLGCFLGGEHRGEVTAFSRALGNAERAVAEQIEGQTFRALEAEAARDDRVPASVINHLAVVIAKLELEAETCNRGE